MQENEFEKQLRKLMGEFKVSPSASVWERIKRSIEERRRRWPLIALLLGAVLITTGYMIYGWNKKEIRNDTAINGDTLQNAQSQLKQQDIFKLNDSVPDVSNKPLQKNITTEQSLKAINEAFEKNRSLPLIEKPDQNYFTDTSKLAVQKNESKNDTAKEMADREENTFADSPVDQNKTADDKINADKKNKEIIKPDTVTQSVPVNDNVKLNKLPDAKKSAGKKTAIHNNLSFGISVYGGRSNTVDNLFNQRQSKNIQSTNSIGPGITAAAVHPVQPFTPSYNFSIGGFVQKNITKKLSVSTGVNYMHFTTKAQTTDITSSVTLAVPGLTSTEFINSYYRPGSNQLQVNKYKFIGASLALHQNIINSKRIPVYADAGVSLMRILSAKTLIYDNNSNAYYSKNDWLQKTQATMQLGVSMHIKLNDRNYLFFGPEVQYGFTNMLKNINYTPQHLVSYGLHGGWMIGKK
jgi:hypothetical protein